MSRIIGVDPGESCGMVVLDGGNISSVFNIISEKLLDKVTNFLIHPQCVVVIEDIRPFSMRLTAQIIDTCKFIGMIVDRLRIDAGADVRLIVRNEVKKWCFDQFPEICIPVIERKIEKKGYKNGNSDDPRKPSFVFVDDKIVMECMKQKYGIPLPPKGKGYRYGLKDHSFQALAVASCFIAKSG